MAHPTAAYSIVLRSFCPSDTLSDRLVFNCYVAFCCICLLNVLCSTVSQLPVYLYIGVSSFVLIIIIVTALTVRSAEIVS